MEKKTYVIVYGHIETVFSGVCDRGLIIHVDGIKVIDAYDIQDVFDAFEKTGERRDHMALKVYRLDEFLQLVEDAMIERDRERFSVNDERISEIEKRVDKVENFLRNMLRPFAAKSRF